jgi:2-keto-4-pentenoate hydratase/2-oxohepta-3-ene-1,7-dioic acid hydratase in catechol pathway
MKYLTFSLPNDRTPRLGAMNNNRIVDVKALAAGKWPGSPPASLLELIQAGPEAWRRMAELMGTVRLKPDTYDTYEMKDVHWHAPIPRPLKNIFCLGLNYRSHAIESATARGREAKIPQAPVFFSKAPTTVNGPYDAIPWDRSVTEQLDYEAELGVILGAETKNIPRARALRHVFGYTVLNDTTGRDLQARHVQWFKGKSLDGCCPMGPVVVTADEFGDPQTKHITLRINGETRQDANTSEMLFPVDAIIEWLSKGMTLEAGDIIATGTPEGVGLGRTPPEYLKDGDLIETEIEGIGTLRNKVVGA